MSPTGGAPPSRRGLFLAFEGVEGAGKSTQVRLLAEHLRGAGRKTVVAREPGSTPLGERIRETVLANTELEVPALSELFLMLAARAAFVEQVVRPAVEAGTIVIADRFELSTLAYQGAGRGIPLDELRVCNRIATRGLSPDATLLLDLDPAVGARRQRSAGKALDRMERESAEFHHRVAEGYRTFAASVPGTLVVEADGDVETVQARILLSLGERFPETFTAARVINSRRG
jgi:dTMP kinase